MIGAGMMGKSAAFDMARSEAVTHVTVADQDGKLAKKVAEFVTANASKGVKVVAAKLDAADQGAAEKLMSKHDGTLSCVPYFFNLGLAKAAIKAGCHFADLGGNNTVVRRAVLTYEVLGMRTDAFAALGGATADVLRDLERDPDLADFCQDSRFKQLVEQISKK